MKSEPLKRDSRPGMTRVVELADDDQRDDADHRAEAEDLVDEVVDRGATDEGQWNSGSKVCPYASNQTMAAERGSRP